MPKGCASSRGAAAVHRESVLHLDCASTNDGVPASALTTTIRNPIEDCWSVVNPALADSRRIQSHGYNPSRDAARDLSFT